MTIEEKNNIITLIKQRKKIFDILGIKIMNESDMKVAKIMADLTPNVTPNFMPTGSIITQNNAINKSFDYLEVFGPEIPNKAKKIVSNIKIYPIYNVLFTYQTHIEYEFDPKVNQVVKNSGNVDHYKIPMKLDEVSPLWIAHENIHALKETNYDEYIDGQILGDVIPMFLELVMVNQVSNDKASSLLRNRLFLLKNEYTSTQEMKKVLSKDLYDIYATSSMQYLNSFNYAFQLYQRYRDNKENIISKIKEVLVGQNTTRNMLDEFAILNKCDSEKVQYELEKVISKIK